MKDRRTIHQQFKRPSDYVWPFIAGFGIAMLASIIYMGLS
jgi:hypothetical protein